MASRVVSMVCGFSLRHVELLAMAKRQLNLASLGTSLGRLPVKSSMKNETHCFN